jgi:hypothetical protein
VKFITFNFDSNIEDRVAEVIPNIYNGQSGIDAAIQAIDVIHVHGRIPAVPQESFRGAGLTAGYTPAGVSESWIEWTRRSIEIIQIVLEDIEPSLLASVQQIIADTKILCFLGFSYDPGNLTKLGVPERLTRDHVAFGSAFSMTLADRADVEARFAPKTDIQLGPADAKCLQMLISHHILRDT